MTPDVPYLDASRIHECVSPRKLRILMREVFLEQPAGEEIDPPRFALALGEHRLGIMPQAPRAENSVKGFHGVKLVNLGSGFGHQGIYAAFDSDTGKVRALMEAGAITALRTAATSAAVSEEILGRQVIRKIGIVGTGAQAAAHIEAFADLYPLAEFLVLSRTRESFLKLHERVPVAIRSRVTRTERLRCAEIVCTLSAAKEPVIGIHDISEAVHINAVGSCSSDHRELTGEVVGCCERFVDSLAQARREAGDFIKAREEGFISDRDFGVEVCRLLRKEHRVSSKRTLFKSVGLARQDLALVRSLLCSL